MAGDEDAVLWLGAVVVGRRAAVVEDGDAVVGGSASQTPLQADPGLRNRYDGYAPREAVGRPLTGYERRGLRDGRPIADLVFEKVGSAEQTGTIEKTEQTGNGDDAGR